MAGPTNAAMSTGGQSLRVDYESTDYKSHNQGVGMNTRSAKGKRWAWNVMKLVGLVIILWLVFIFRGNAFKGLVEAGMLLLVGLVCTGIAFAMGWLSAGGGAQPKGGSSGGASAPAGDAGQTATASGGGPAENAKDAVAPVAPVAPVATSAREPGVADFDGARQRHE